MTTLAPHQPWGGPPGPQTSCSLRRQASAALGTWHHTRPRLKRACRCVVALRSPRQRRRHRGLFHTGLAAQDVRACQIRDIWQNIRQKTDFPEMHIVLDCLAVLSVSALPKTLHSHIRVSLSVACASSQTSRIESADMGARLFRPISWSSYVPSAKLER